jgi:hypothetical protein
MAKNLGVPPRTLPLQPHLQGQKKLHSLPVHGLHDLDLNLLLIQCTQHPVSPVLSAFEVNHENLMQEAKGKETQVTQVLLRAVGNIFGRIRGGSGKEKGTCSEDCSISGLCDK